MAALILASRSRSRACRSAMPFLVMPVFGTLLPPGRERRTKAVRYEGENGKNAARRARRALWS